jgi:hypothetical protein
LNGVVLRIFNRSDKIPFCFLDPEYGFHLQIYYKI